MWNIGAVPTIISLLLVVASVASDVSSPGLLYIYPASKGRGRAAEVSPSQLRHVLAYALNVPMDTLGVGIGDSEAWDWIVPTNNGKQSVEVLFEDSSMKNVIIFTDVEKKDFQDLFPSKLRNTHQISTPPHVSSFEALIESYVQQMASVISTSKGQMGAFFTASVGKTDTALESTFSWLMGDAMTAMSSWQDSIGSVDINQKGKSAFARSVKDLIAYFDRGEQEQSEGHELAPLQALRFNGLGDIKSTYGSESLEFKEAKQIIRSLLEAAMNRMDSLHTQNLAIIALPNQDHTIIARWTDPLTPFRSSLHLTPFLTTRDDIDKLKKNSSTAPKESDFIGKCFSNEDDLNKATANCSSHGNATQSSQGGRKCYRCKCQQSVGQGNKIITWAGAACQKQDLSEPFVLLFTTTLGLVLVILGSVLYLFNEGQKELPSVLAGISIPNK